MEKIIHAQLKDYLEEQKLLTQHGFRKNHSTLSACAKFLNDIMMGLDAGEWTLAVFLDIKKAFDTINHKILLNKSKQFSIGQKR